MATPPAFKVQMECTECKGMFQVVFRQEPAKKYAKGPTISGRMRVHSRADKPGSYNCKGGNSTVATTELSNAQFRAMSEFFRNQK